MFISVDNPDSKAYSAIIQGMAKYGQVNRALELFEEATLKGFKLNTDTYNSIIKCTPTLRENNQKRLDFLIKILNQLNENGLKPNTGTFNASIEVLSLCKTDRLCRSYIFKFLREFKELGIEPSLATYYSILTAFYREGCRFTLMETVSYCEIFRTSAINCSA